MYAQCPKDKSHSRFRTSAHVSQDWEVDNDGGWVNTIVECLEVTHDPHPDNLWLCLQCGERADILPEKPADAPDGVSFAARVLKETMHKFSLLGWTGLEDRFIEIYLCKPSPDFNTYEAQMIRRMMLDAGGIWVWDNFNKNQTFVLFDEYFKFNTTNTVS